MRTVKATVILEYEFSDEQVDFFKKLAIETGITKFDVNTEEGLNDYLAATIEDAVAVDYDDIERGIECLTEQGELFIRGKKLKNEAVSEARLLGKTEEEIKSLEERSEESYAHAEDNEAVRVDPKALPPRLQWLLEDPEIANGDKIPFERDKIPQDLQYIVEKPK